MSRKEIIRERPFEYLTASAENWYIARAYVLDKLRDVAFTPGSDGHLHVIVAGDSPLLLSTARQVALSAHYLNFEEENALGERVSRNRTVITLVTGKKADDILRELSREEYLGQLLSVCRYTLFGETHNADSYLDIEVELVEKAPEAPGAITFTEEDIKAFLASADPEEVFSIDTRKAVFANRVYSLGAVIDNIPYEDINGAGRYSRALDTFQYRKLQEQQQSYQQYVVNKQQEMAEEQQVMMNQIANAISEFVQEYNTTHGYAMILATAGNILSTPVVTADPKLDITEDLLAGLNAAYIKTKENTKK